jgi:hypothetical protein
METSGMTKPTAARRDARTISPAPQPGDEPPGREHGKGRPSGVPGGAWDGAGGRPTVVRQAQPETPPAHTQPTEGAVDRGLAPDTELDPGQDL